MTLRISGLIWLFAIRLFTWTQKETMHIPLDLIRLEIQNGTAQY